jgi:hypothetical protein
MSDPGVAPAKKTYPRLTKWASAFTSICFLIILAVKLFAWFGPVSLPDCDGSAVQDTIRDIFREKVKTEITAFDAVTAGAKTAETLACTADLSFPDKSRARLTYHVHIKDREVLVVTDDVKDL